MLTRERTKDRLRVKVKRISEYKSIKIFSLDWKRGRGRDFGKSEREREKSSSLKGWISLLSASSLAHPEILKAVRFRCFLQVFIEIFSFKSQPEQRLLSSRRLHSLFPFRLSLLRLFLTFPSHFLFHFPPFISGQHL